MDWINEVGRTAALYLLKAMTEDLGKQILEMLSRLLFSPMALLSDLDVLELIRFSRSLAWLILPVVLIRQGITLATDRAEGAATEPTETFVRRAVTASLAVAGSTAIVGWLMRFTDSLIESFLQASTNITLLNGALSFPNATGSFSLVFMTLVLVVGFIILLIQRTILTATLAIMMGLGPIAATSLAWGESPLWGTWLREVISILLSFLLHTVLLWWLLRKLGSWGTDTFDSRLLLFGTLIVMLKAPSLIRQWTYAAGGGGAVLNGAADATRTVVMYRMLRAAPAAVIKR